MKISVQSSNKQRKSKKSPLQKRFDKLSAQVEREDRKLSRLRSELDGLVHEFHMAGLDADRKHLDGLIALAERISVFASRKSLSNWHREDMADWFSELINRIGLIDEAERTRLLEAYDNSIAHLSGMSPEEFRALLDEHLQQQRAEEEAWARDRERRRREEAETAFQDELFTDPDDEKPIWETADEPEAEPRADSRSDPLDDLLGTAPQDHKDLTDEAWIKRLFRRAAQQLHPDRESDKQTREEKSKRMGELLKARREGDLLALLRIYGEAVGENSLDLAEEQMTALCDALEARIEAIEHETVRFLMEDPERFRIHQFLFSTSKTRQRKNLQNMRKDALKSVQEEIQLTEIMRNLESLKIILQERSDFHDAMNEKMMNVFLDDQPE